MEQFKHIFISDHKIYILILSYLQSKWDFYFAQTLPIALMVAIIKRLHSTQCLHVPIYDPGPAPLVTLPFLFLTMICCVSVPVLRTLASLVWRTFLWCATGRKSNFLQYLLFLFKTLNSSVDRIFDCYLLIVFCIINVYDVVLYERWTQRVVEEGVRDIFYVISPLVSWGARGTPWNIPARLICETVSEPTTSEYES